MEREAQDESHRRSPQASVPKRRGNGRPLATPCENLHVPSDPVLVRVTSIEPCPVDVIRLSRKILESQNASARKTFDIGGSHGCSFPGRFCRRPPSVRWRTIVRRPLWPFPSGIGVLRPDQRLHRKPPECGLKRPRDGQEHRKVGQERGRSSKPYRRRDEVHRCGQEPALLGPGIPEHREPRLGQEHV